MNREYIVSANLPTETIHYDSSLPQYAVSYDRYDALRPSGKRRAASGRVVREDQILKGPARRRLASNALDLHRNFALAAWAIRRHLDYTTLFDFHPMTGDDGLNADLKWLMRRDNQARNCDIGGRHSWNRMRRLAEVIKVLHGDAGLLQLQSGHLQGVEGASIRNPTTSRLNSERWENGVRLGPGRRALAYNVLDRRPDGTTRDRKVSAARLMLLAAFEGRFDQVRGISSFAGSMNDFRDLYEGLDLMRQRLKVDQIFHMALFRHVDNGDDQPLPQTPQASTSEGAQDEYTNEPPPMHDLPDRPSMLDMDQGEDAKPITAANPSTQAQEFLKLSIAIALKSLDLPFNFFDESFTNFFGSRAAWIGYERACVSKREDQLELHRRYTTWRMARWMLPTSLGGTGEIVLPRSIDLTRKQWFKWVPRGVPWWKPQEELTTDIMAAAVGLKTFEGIAEEHGLGDWDENVKELRREFERAQQAGMTLAFNPKRLSASLTFQTDTMEVAA